MNTVYVVMDPYGVTYAVYKTKELAIKHCQTDTKCAWAAYQVNETFPPAHTEGEY
jgi:hypothetical protein